MANLKRRSFSLLTALMLVLSLFSFLPDGALRAEAADTYGLMLGDITVTSTNKNDILGNGEAEYDANSRTLTLYKDIDTIRNDSAANLTVKAANNVKAIPHNPCASDAKSIFPSECINSTQPC